MRGCYRIDFNFSSKKTRNNITVYHRGAHSTYLWYFENEYLQNHKRSIDPKKLESKASMGKRVQAVLSSFEFENTPAIDQVNVTFDKDLARNSSVEYYILKYIRESNCYLRTWDSSDGLKISLDNVKPLHLLGEIFTAFANREQSLGKCSKFIDIDCVKKVPGIQKYLQPT